MQFITFNAIKSNTIVVKKLNSVYIVVVKMPILNDEELSDFLHKVRNTTCAYFKVISPYPQQQQQQESSTRCYLMMIIDSKIKDSLELLLQYIKDN